MSKPALGVVVGAVLGAIDGASAWISPEARPMIATIVLGSTVKGIATGLAAGLIARSKRSISLGLAAGLLIGFVLSAIVAMSQPGHFFEIVLPGMLLGAIVGFATQKYPRQVTGSTYVIVLAIAAPLLTATSATVAAQSAAPDDGLAPLAGLIGLWTGSTEGQPGRGTVERQYERVLGSKFIQVRNRSTYPPQDKNRKGEVHEDLGFFSFDTARKRIVFRQFHVEGFVNQYALDPATTSDRIVFASEAIENIPAGWRARETYVLAGPDQLEEIFELAAPGKDFEVYSRNRLTRAR